MLTCSDLTQPYDPDAHTDVDGWGDDPTHWGGEIQAWGTDRPGETLPWGTDSDGEALPWGTDTGPPVLALAFDLAMGLGPIVWALAWLVWSLAQLLL
jgi:hypothetical protein